MDDSQVERHRRPTAPARQWLFVLGGYSPDRRLLAFISSIVGLLLAIGSFTDSNHTKCPGCILDGDRHSNSNDSLMNAP